MKNRRNNRFILFPCRLPVWVLNFAAIALIYAAFTSITKAQADTLTQYEKRGYANLWGGPVGSPGEDCEFIVAKSSTNFAKHSVAQPGKYRKVVFSGGDSIPDEIRFQNNLEEIHLYIDPEISARNYNQAKPNYISKEVLGLPRLKSVHVYGNLHIDEAVNLLNPNLEYLSLTMFKVYFSKTDPATLQLPENLTWLSTNMVDELERPILRCKKLKTFRMSPFDMMIPTYFDQVTSLENLSIGVIRFDTINGFPHLNPLTNLKQLTIYNGFHDRNRLNYLDLSNIEDMGIKHIKFIHANAAMITQLCRFPELESLTITDLDYYWEIDGNPRCGSQTLRKLVLAGYIYFDMDSLGIEWQRLRHLAIKYFDGDIQYHLDDYWLGNPVSTLPLPLLPDITLAPDADTLVLINIEPSTTRLLPASPGLRHVLLANNNLQSLPPACSAWVHLRYLNLSHNQLDDLPDGLQALQSLDTLNLNANRFTHFPRVLLRGLSPRFVSLTNNELRSIPKDIDLLAHTEVLDLRGNQIARIPTATLRAIQRMPQLKELRLADNPIRQEDIPVELREKLVF